MCIYILDHKRDTINKIILFYRKRVLIKLHDGFKKYCLKDGE